MIDVAILKLVGFSAVAVVVVGWLVTSFLPAGQRRHSVARLSSVGIYVALACLFTNLTQTAWADDRTVLLVPFAFLWVLFLAGTVVSFVKWVGELRGGTAGSHATH